jgi:hypothetical protein
MRIIIIIIIIFIFITPEAMVPIDTVRAQGGGTCLSE